MSTTIAPGTQVQVTVIKKPTNAAAQKTIIRLLCKDKTVKADAARLRKSRAAGLQWNNRGGREWAVRVPKIQPVQATVGVSKSIKATLDVLTDLKSVSQFVEVKAI